MKNKIVYILIAILFIVFILSIIIVPMLKDTPTYNTYDRPKNFTEGVWIVKYPDNCASFRFETPEGLIIVSDPFNMNEVIKPDVVTVSHPDADHSDFSYLLGPYTTLDTTGEFTMGNVMITGIKGRHDNPRAITNVRDMWNNIYVFDFNGIKIVHFASQGVYPDEEMFKKIGNADMLLIQIFSGGIKLSVEECAEISGKLGAKIIIPEHGNQKLTSSFAEIINSKVQYNDNGELIVTQDSLKSIKEPEVIVLDN